MTRHAWRSTLWLAAGAAVLWVPLGAQAPTIELRGEGFVLRGTIAPDRLSAVACDLETAVRMLPPLRAGVPTPRVAAVGNAGGVREWLPTVREPGAGNALGGYWQGPYGHHIVVRVDTRPDERLRRVLHEYAHFVTHVAHPQPPRWLDEGLSEVWEHAAITAGTITIGTPVAGHLKRLRSVKHWIPVETLTSAVAIPVGNSDPAMFYAQSWALVHYLVFERGGGTLNIGQLAAPATFPTDAQLRAYVAGPMAPGVTTSAVAPASPACQGQAEVRRLSELEALIGRAQALADGARPDAALPLLQAALRLDATSDEAMEVLGFVHFSRNRPAEAASIFDRLIADGKGSYISYYYRAVLASTVPEQNGGGGPIPQVEYLRKSVALNPEFAPAAERLKELLGKGLALASLSELVRK